MLIKTKNDWHKKCRRNKFPIAPKIEGCRRNACSDQKTENGALTPRPPNPLAREKPSHATKESPNGECCKKSFDSSHRVMWPNDSSTTTRGLQYKRTRGFSMIRERRLMGWICARHVGLETSVLRWAPGLSGNRSQFFQGQRPAIRWGSAPQRGAIPSVLLLWWPFRPRGLFPPEPRASLADSLCPGLLSSVPTGLSVCASQRRD